MAVEIPIFLFHQPPPLSATPIFSVRNFSAWMACGLLPLLPEGIFVRAIVFDELNNQNSIGWEGRRRQ